MTPFSGPRAGERDPGLAPVLRSRRFAARAAHPSAEGCGRGGPALLLAGPVVVAEQGRRTRLPLRVRNRTTLVDDLRIEVLGPASEWSTVTPDVVGLLPGEEVDVTVLLTPPRSGAGAVEEVAFAVRVSSVVPPHDSFVEEALVRVVSTCDPGPGLRLLGR